MEERYNLTLNVLRFTLLIATLGLAIGCSGKDDSLRQSEMLIRSGMHPEAINLLEKIIAVEDRNPKARFLLGQAYEGLGSYDQAIHNYRTAINLYAAHPEDRSTVRLVLAKVYLKQGLRERGYNELRTIVRSTSDSAVLQQVARLVTDAYEVAQLTSDKSDNYSPRFSPDGSQLAFASYRLDNGEIFIMDLDGRVRQRVTFTTDFDEGEPAFLHDPHHLIYSREPQTSRQVKILLQSSGSTPIYAGFYTTHIHSKVTPRDHARRVRRPLVGDIAGSAACGLRIEQCRQSGVVYARSARRGSGCDRSRDDPVPADHPQRSGRWEPGLLPRRETACVCFGTV